MAGEPATALDLSNEPGFLEFSKDHRSAEELALLARIYIRRGIEAADCLDGVVKDFCLRALDDHHWLAVGRMMAEPLIRHIDKKAR